MHNSTKASWPERPLCLAGGDTGLTGSLPVNLQSKATAISCPSYPYIDKLLEFQSFSSDLTKSESIGARWRSIRRTFAS